MKNKKTWIVIGCVIALSFLLGATGTVRLAGNASVPVSTEQDRLIGALVTTDDLDLFDFEGFAKENAEKIVSGQSIGSMESDQFQGRLYASLTEQALTDEDTGETLQRQDYRFENLDGIQYFAATMSDTAGEYTSSSSDPRICDGHMAIQDTDTSKEISLEGTIYVSTKASARTFYCNPVYQTPEGKVYVVSGEGMMFSGDRCEGMASTQKLSAETQDMERRRKELQHERGNYNLLSRSAGFNHLIPAKW